MSNKRTVLFLIFAAIACILTLAYWSNCDRQGNRENLNKDFAGVVKHIEYDIKQFPIMILGDSTYFIGSGYNTEHQIEVGDSIIKRKGSEVYKLIKFKTHKVIEFSK